ncbi:hypothetical protein T439DRAFT_323688 [Meredithblackwellia eburnea MCA 4105]
MDQMEPPSYSRTAQDGETTLERTSRSAHRQQPASGSTSLDAPHPQRRSPSRDLGPRKLFGDRNNCRYVQPDSTLRARTAGTPSSAPGGSREDSPSPTRSTHSSLSTSSASSPLNSLQFLGRLLVPSFLFSPGSGSHSGRRRESDRLHSRTLDRVGTSSSAPPIYDEEEERGRRRVAFNGAVGRRQSLEFEKSRQDRV